MSSSQTLCRRKRAANLGKKQKQECSPRPLNRRQSRARRQNATTHLPSHRVGVSVQVIEALQVFCVDDGGSWHLPPPAASVDGLGGSYSQSIFFSDDREKGKDTGLVLAHRWKQTQILLQNYVPTAKVHVPFDIIILPFKRTYNQQHISQEKFCFILAARC